MPTFPQPANQCAFNAVLWQYLQKWQSQNMASVPCLPHCAVRLPIATRPMGKPLPLPHTSESKVKVACKGHIHVSLCYHLLHAVTSFLWSPFLVKALTLNNSGVLRAKATKKGQVPFRVPRKCAATFTVKWMPSIMHYMPIKHCRFFC